MERHEEQRNRLARGEETTIVLERAALGTQEDEDEPFLVLSRRHQNTEREETGDQSLDGEEDKGETTDLAAGVLKFEEPIQGMHQKMGEMMGSSETSRAWWIRVEQQNLNSGQRRKIYFEVTSETHHKRVKWDDRTSERIEKRDQGVGDDQTTSECVLGGR